MSTVRCSRWPSATARLKAMVVLPTPPFGAKTEKMRVGPTSELARELLLDARDPVHEVEAGERHREDAVDARRRVDARRVLGHGQDDDRDARAGARAICSTSLGPLIRPCSRASTRTTSGPQLADLGERLAPVGHDVEQLDCDCAFSRPRMYCATCGTSSTSRRRVWSLLPEEPDMGLDDTTGPSPGTHPTVRDATARRVRARRRDEDRPLRAGPERRLEVVATGDELDPQAGVLGEAGELVGRHEAQPVAPDPAGRAGSPWAPSS